MRFLLPALLLVGSTALAQTAPAPYDFGAANTAYSLRAWDPATPAGTYPPNMAFHRFSAAAPTKQETAAGDWTCPYSLTARPRVLGKDTLGFSFLNTSSAQYDDCVSGANTLSTYVGEAVLALNTTGASAVEVRWKGRMFGNLTYSDSAQNRVYGIALQYRTAAGAAYSELPAATFLAADTLVRQYRPQFEVQAFRVALPAAALDQPAVEVRWIYHAVAGTTGTRPELGVDDIVVTATSTPNGLPPLTDGATRAALRVIPTPTGVMGAEVVMTLPVGSTVPAAAEVWTSTGQCVLKLRAEPTAAATVEGRYRLPAHALPAGLYRVRAGAASAPLVIE